MPNRPRPDTAVDGLARLLSFPPTPEGLNAFSAAQRAADELGAAEPRDDESDPDAPD